MRSIAITAVALACLMLAGRWWLAWEPMAAAQAGASPTLEADIAPWIEPPSVEWIRSSKLSNEPAGTL